MARAQDSEQTNQIAVTRKLHVNWFPKMPLMTIRKGILKVFSKLEVACTLAVIAWSKPGYTVLQSRQKTVVKLSISITVSLSVSLPVSVTVLAPLTLPPTSSLSLSLSLCRTLPVALFVCDSVDSRSFMLYFALALSLYLSEVCSLSISLSLGSLFSPSCSLSLYITF